MRCLGGADVLSQLQAMEGAQCGSVQIRIGEGKHL